MYIPTSMEAIMRVLWCSSTGRICLHSTTSMIVRLRVPVGRFIRVELAALLAAYPTIQMYQLPFRYKISISLQMEVDSCQEDHERTRRHRDHITRWGMDRLQAQSHHKEACYILPAPTKNPITTIMAKSTFRTAIKISSRPRTQAKTTRPQPTSPKGVIMCQDQATVQSVHRRPTATTAIQASQRPK